jgi:hypothetical protein
MSNKTITKSRQKVNGGTQETREFYEKLGFDTLPLKEKKAIRRGWPDTPPYRLWQNAPGDANIGIRGGGAAKVAVIDADDKERPGTSESVIRYFESLGLPPGAYPWVQTASGVGHHAYLSLTGDLDGNAHKLASDMAGELRHGPGSYVVAPPSVVGSSTYSLIAGQWEHLPVVSVTDLLPIIGTVAHETRVAHKIRAEPGRS